MARLAGEENENVLRTSLHCGAKAGRGGLRNRPCRSPAEDEGLPGAAPSQLGQIHFSLGAQDFAQLLAGG